MDDNECRFDDDDGTDCSPTEVLPFAVPEHGGSETLFPCDKPLENKDDCNDPNLISSSTPFSSSSSSSSLQQLKPKSVDTSLLTPFKSYYESIQLSTASVPPPGLMSSIISQDDSILSTTPSALDDSFHQQHAASLLATSAAVGQSSHLPHSRVWASCAASASHRPHDSSMFLGGTQGGSVGFSQLMQKADDTNDTSVVTSQHYPPHHALANTTATAARMPRLTEESELSSSSTTLPRTHTATTSSPTRYHRRSNTTTTMSSSPASVTPNHNNNWIQNLFTRPISSTTGSISQPYLSVPLTDDSVVEAQQSHCSSYHHYHDANNNNNSTTWSDRRLVESVIVDDTSYQVSITMMNTTSVREVLDVMSNPDFLPLWCEPLHKGVIITKSSEGSCSATQRQPTVGGQREVCYDPNHGEKKHFYLLVG
jgi:hypothetical protein